MNAYAEAAKLMAQVQKAGARHSSKDNSLIQQLHDLSCELGAECPMKDMAIHPQLKAAVEALVLRHPGHGNQKTHGNRFGGYGTTKESLRRLKGDKEGRERYKTEARKRGAKNPVDKERLANAKKLVSTRTAAPRVIVMGSDPKTLTKQLGLPEDFYTWQDTGEMYSFGVRTKIGQHIPSDKYLTKEYTEAKDRYDKAVKRQDRFQQDYYYKKAENAWRDVVSNARKKVIG